MLEESVIRIYHGTELFSGHAGIRGQADDINRGSSQGERRNILTAAFLKTEFDLHRL